MGLILKIAWRNILRHKSKSLIIGAILFLGALIMTFGNGVVGGMDKGLQKNIVEGFTGDAILVANKQESDNVFMEFMGRSVEPILNYPTLDSILHTLPYVDRHMPVGKNALMHLSEESSNPGFSFVLGTDFERYTKVFPNCVKAVEGRLLNPGEKGILMTTSQREELYNWSNIWCVAVGETLDVSKLPEDIKKDSASLIIKDSLVFMGMNENNATYDVRLPIVGIIKYRALDKIFGHFPIMDIESYRTCMGYLSAEDKIEVTGERKALLEMEGDNLDALFGNSALMVANTAPVKGKAVAAKEPATVAPTQQDIDAGTYNMVLIFFKDDIQSDEGLRRLNEDLKTAEVRAISWKKAFGIIGSIAMLIKSALFVFVMFIFFVAIIIIVNTLSMAALERTNEIGMMRAVGARKGFISNMFFCETGLLSAVFGGLGIVCGTIAVHVVSALHFTSDNDMVQLFYGGDTFSPVLSSVDIVLAVFQLALVTLIAVVYPLRVARSITPLDAIARE
ncbi:MAG: hypothetical protein A2293_03340 [Elusimicrobia bacterium RIFOXYB2_FULL_49_7]|nr:MAG: hypothetical protein A2293_03340 [Elusimicrobia bacterium RIFOXYB2_FULL_49_7]